MDIKVAKVSAFVVWAHFKGQQYHDAIYKWSIQLRMDVELQNLFIYLFLIFIFMATPGAYGSSQSRGQVRDAATATAIAMMDMRQGFNLHHSSRQCQIHIPLSKAIDRACIRVDTSRVLNPLSHNRNSQDLFQIYFRSYKALLSDIYAHRLA